MEKQTKEAHENVILLAMSTLPAKLRWNTYKIEEDEETWYFKGLSQLEPHTKYVLRHLAGKGERLDRIVILESKDAREKRPENFGGKTATEFYKMRIFHYLGDPDDLEQAPEDNLKDQKEEPILQDLYKDCKPEIRTVDLEGPVYFWYAAQEIRSREGKKVHLYMDMQGGERSSVAQMNAIATLLVRQNVEIKGCYADDFEPTATLPLYRIYETGEKYRTYEFVTAMDIFIRYGWGDKLKEYFTGKVQEDSRESRLIATIEEASKAISLCDDNAFDSAVNKIGELQKEFGAAGPSTEMDVVYQDIYETYRKLIGAKYRYVEQIRWCLDKNFLQQALTIFEAKMPSEFVCSGLIYYMTKDGNRDKFMRVCENEYRALNRENEPNREDKSEGKKEGWRMEDINHYLIKSYYHLSQDLKSLLSYGLKEAGKKKTENLVSKYQKICKLRNQVNHAAQREHPAGGFYEHIAKKYGWKNNTNQGTDIKKRICDYLDKWEKLADQVPDEIRENVVDLR